MTHPRASPAARRTVAPAALAVAALLAGCTVPVETCTNVHVFEWDAPGLYDALADGTRWSVTNATAGPGLPPQRDDFAAYGEPRISSIRYSDPDEALRNANAHFGDPGTRARIVATVPPHDDRPEPLFDALWDGLDFSADREAARAEFLDTRADTGHLISYQVEVEPSIDLEAWLAARGGLDAGDAVTPQLGAVQVLWDDWRLEMRVPWRAWTYNGEKAPHRLQAMPHGPAMLLVDTNLTWNAEQAATWMRGHAEEQGLPTTGLDAVARGPIERVCT